MILEKLDNHLKSVDEVQSYASTLTLEIQTVFNLQPPAICLSVSIYFP